MISAPTGSGKSTQVPRWARDLERHKATVHHRSPRPILVIEPRRIACQSLAQRISWLESSTLGQHVGYTVRDEDRSSAETEIRFVTTGVALRLWRAHSFNDYGAVIIDEFHERTLDLDLLLALCQSGSNSPLIVMSATFAAKKITEHLSGVHLSGEGRRFDVTVSYRTHGNARPHLDGLMDALPSLVDQACETVAERGLDILVFLPGKGEINETIYRLESAWHKRGLLEKREALPLHGALKLKAQAAIFKKTHRQRVILATNVAETSLTVPKVGIVIDSGLVRRTRYDRGQGALSLTEVAHDSAEQRRGRAGRLSDGQCWRLWSSGVTLKPYTPPEIYRESLASLYLAASACGANIEELPLLDMPRDNALQDANEVLKGLGAIDVEGQITDCGEALFKLGIHLNHGRWLIEGTSLKDETVLEHLVCLVSGLSITRGLFLSGRVADPTYDLRSEGCDATALIKAVQMPIDEAERYHINPQSLKEAQEHRKRLRRALKLSSQMTQLQGQKIKRHEIAQALIKADPNNVYIKRERRRQKTAWVGGGPEMTLGRESALAMMMDAKDRERVDAIFVLESHVVAKSSRVGEYRISVGFPLQLEWIKKSDLGEERVGEAQLRGASSLYKSRESS